MFLATTALTEFWKADSPTLFLGDWCLLYEGKKSLQRTTSNVVPFPFDDDECLKSSMARCDAAYERVLPVLANVLDQHHGVSLGEPYWRCVIGPWLNQFIHVMCDRVLCVQAALRRHGDLETIGLLERSYFTPRDGDDFLSNVHTDAYNLQLFTHVCESLGVRVLEKKDIRAHARDILPSHWKSRLISRFKKVLMGRMSRVVHPLAYARAGQAWYFDHRIPLSTQAALFLRTRGAAVFTRFHRYQPDQEAVTIDRHARAEFAQRVGAALGPADDFERILVSSFPANFPWLYLEKFSSYRSQLGPIVDRMPRTVMSTSNNVPFQFLSAELKARGHTKIVLAQRGGAFGVNRRNPLEEHDELVSDEYWSWGWTEGLARKATPMPAFLLGPMAARKARRGKGEILYCSNSCPRYTYRMWSNPHGPQWKNVIDWQHRWLSAVSDATRAEVVIRLYVYDHYQWREKERLRDFFPSVHLDEGRRSFDDALANARLFVTDNNHTTFLQALAIDTPTIVFWEGRFNALRPAAQPYFDALRDVGVLHETPESAARKTDEVSARPEEWWRRPDVQRAVNAFRKQFCLTDPAASDIWARELQRLSRR